MVYQLINLSTTSTLSGSGGDLTVNLQSGENFLGATTYMIFPDGFSPTFSNVEFQHSSGQTIGASLSGNTLTLSNNVISASATAINTSSDIDIFEGGVLDASFNASDMDITLRRGGTLTLGNITGVMTFTQNSEGILNVDIQVGGTGSLQSGSITATTLSIDSGSTLSFTFQNSISEVIATLPSSVNFISGSGGDYTSLMTPAEQVRFSLDEVSYLQEYFDYTLTSTGVTINDINIAIDPSFALNESNIRSLDTVNTSVLVSDGVVDGTFNVMGDFSLQKNGGIILGDDRDNVVPAMPSMTSPTCTIVGDLIIDTTFGSPFLEFNIDYDTGSSSIISDFLQVNGMITVSGSRRPQIILNTVGGDLSSFTDGSMFTLFHIRTGSNSSNVTREDGSDFSESPFDIVASGVGIPSGSTDDSIITFTLSPSGEVTVNVQSQDASFTNSLTSDATYSDGDLTILNGGSLTVGSSGTVGNTLAVKNSFYQHVMSTLTFDINPFVNGQSDIITVGGDVVISSVSSTSDNPTIALAFTGTSTATTFDAENIFARLFDVRGSITGSSNYQFSVTNAPTGVTSSSSTLR